MVLASQSNMEPELMAKQKLNVLKRKSEKTGEMQKGETDHVAPKEAERADVSVCLFLPYFKTKFIFN